MSDLKVGDRVTALGQNGRFEIVQIKGSTAKLKLLANKKDTDEPVELNYRIDVPISTLKPLLTYEGVDAVRAVINGEFASPAINETPGGGGQDTVLSFSAQGRNFSVSVTPEFDQDYKSGQLRVDLKRLAPILRASKTGKALVARSGISS